jgi:hypothetical protein
MADPKSPKEKTKAEQEKIMKENKSSDSGEGVNITPPKQKTQFSADEIGNKLQLNVYLREFIKRKYSKGQHKNKSYKMDDWKKMLKKDGLDL